MNAKFHKAYLKDILIQKKLRNQKSIIAEKIWNH